MVEKRYRLVDSYLLNVNPTMEEYFVVRKTEKGAWVVPGYWYRTMHGSADAPISELRERFFARFVLNGDGKRFAHETVELARNSYRIRKLRQIKHAKSAIESAEAALVWLDSGQLPEPDFASLF